MIKADPRGSGRELAGAMFPIVILALTMFKLDKGVQLLLVQLVFLFFSTIAEECRGTFVCSILSPLCIFLQGIHRPEDEDVVLFCGKGLTHLARSCADAFRETVAGLTIQNREALQIAMAASIKQEQAAQQQSSGFQNTAVAQVGAVKKLDFAKFQKAPVISPSMPIEALAAVSGDSSTSTH